MRAAAQITMTATATACRAYLYLNSQGPSPTALRSWAVPAGQRQQDPPQGHSLMQQLQPSAV